MEHVKINFFHDEEDQEERCSPDYIWDHEAVKPRLQFYYKIELFFRPVKKQIPGDHGKQGWCDLKSEIYKARINAFFGDVDIGEPVINQYHVYYQESDFVNMLQILLHKSSVLVIGFE